VKKEEGVFYALLFAVSRPKVATLLNLAAPDPQIILTRADIFLRHSSPILAASLL
jgi:hypothetical protein